MALRKYNKRLQTTELEERGKKKEEKQIITL
jgi:hypothetical protein